MNRNYEMESVLGSCGNRTVVDSLAFKDGIWLVSKRPCRM